VECVVGENRSLLQVASRGLSGAPDPSAEAIHTIRSTTPAVRERELQGDRVTLRVLGPEHAAQVALFFRENAAHLAPWSPPGLEKLATIEGSREKLAVDAARATEGTAARWHLFEGDALVGHAGLSQIFRGPFCNAYLGYALAGTAQGRGLMTEALRLVVAQAFGPLKLHRLQANHVVGNERSARVLARLGFRVEGIAERYLYIAGAWRDHVMTALTHDALEAPPP
jgi:ribosomal-protein-alanine N-acetyltransferase